MKADVALLEPGEELLVTGKLARTRGRNQEEKRRAAASKGCGGGWQSREGKWWGAGESAIALFHERGKRCRGGVDEEIKWREMNLILVIHLLSL